MIRLRLLISVLVVGIGSAASAGQLVTNGGFELPTPSGGFSSWTGSAVDDNVNNFVGGSSGVGIAPYAGSKQAYFGTSSPEVISQSLSTTVNGSETISFALADIAGSNTDYVKVYFGGTPSANAVIGGTLLATISNAGSGYKTYSYNATATSSSTILSFVITSPGGGWALWRACRRRGGYLWAGRCLCCLCCRDCLVWNLCTYRHPGGSLWARLSLCVRLFLVVHRRLQHGCHGHCCGSDLEQG